MVGGDGLKTVRDEDGTPGFDGLPILLRWSEPSRMARDFRSLSAAMLPR